MRINRKIGFGMLLLILHSSLIGCTPSKIKIQPGDNQFVSIKNTNLVAGLKEIKDNRPKKELENEQRYEKPSQVDLTPLIEPVLS